MTTTDEVPMPEPPKPTHVHPMLGEMWDRLDLQRHAIAYADARCAKLQEELAAANARGDRWSITAQEVDHDLQKMTEERDALAEKVKALEADARRYRQLKPQFFWEDERDMGPGGRWWVSVSVHKGRPTLDAAIDAAIGGGEA